MKPEILPQTVWQDDHVVMPFELANAYRAELNHLSLFDECCGPPKKDSDLIGGDGEHEAHSHFAHRFSTSSARLEYVYMNPRDEFTEAANELGQFLLDGRVSILDIPCGTGGGLFGLLSTLAELRSHKLSPQLPLDIHILAADLSIHARSIHAEMSSRLSERLLLSGIRLSIEYSEWDVKDVFSTAQLTDIWLSQSPVPDAFLILISAFGGFTQDNKEHVKSSLQQIIARFHNDQRRLFVAWVEPSMSSNKKWLPAVRDFFAKMSKKIWSSNGDESDVKFKWKHPFTNVSIGGSAQVIVCNRGGYLEQ